MSFKLSKKSSENLSQCDVKLQALVNEVLEAFDVAVICGHRGKAEQEQAYQTGFSLAKFGLSKHNSTPSKAVDIVPYPIPMKQSKWDDSSQLWDQMAEIAKHEAKRLGIRIKWGGDFQNLKDKPHFELID